MNITFLIGNGFDLNIGLSTTFSNFLERYVEESLSDTAIIQHFKNSVLKDTELWANAELAFGAATQQFEDEICSADDFCACHEDFCINLAKYLQRQEKRLNYAALKNTIVKGFSAGIRNFKKGFREAEAAAISNDEERFDGGYNFNFISFNYTSVLDHCMSATKEKAGSVGIRRWKRYTADNSFDKLIHVHGTVHKDMVLGVNDISQITCPSLFDGVDEEYINEIIKQKTNEINEENSDKKAYDILRSSDLIYIYGMSTGETDKLWWQRICTIMSQKKNLHLIIHKYDAPEEGLIRRKYRLYVSDVKKSFIAYSDLDEEMKADIEKRIHIANANIFEELHDLVNSSENVHHSYSAAAIV